MSARSHPRAPLRHPPAPQTPPPVRPHQHPRWRPRGERRPRRVAPRAPGRPASPRPPRRRCRHPRTPRRRRLSSWPRLDEAVEVGAFRTAGSVSASIQLRTVSLSGSGSCASREPYRGGVPGAKVGAPTIDAASVLTSSPFPRLRLPPSPVRSPPTARVAAFRSRPGLSRRRPRCGRRSRDGPGSRRARA